MENGRMLFKNHWPLSQSESLIANNGKFCDERTEQEYQLWLVARYELAETLSPLISEMVYSHNIGEDAHKLAVEALRIIRDVSMERRKG